MSVFRCDGKAPWGVSMLNLLNIAPYGFEPLWSGGRVHMTQNPVAVTKESVGRFLSLAEYEPKSFAKLKGFLYEFSSTKIKTEVLVGRVQAETKVRASVGGPWNVIFYWPLTLLKEKRLTLFLYWWKISFGVVIFIDSGCSQEQGNRWLVSSLIVRSQSAITQYMV